MGDFGVEVKVVDVIQKAREQLMLMQEYIMSCQNMRSHLDDNEGGFLSKRQHLLQGADL